MATKLTRLVCCGEGLFIVTDGEIEASIDIDANIVKEEIDSIMSQRLEIQPILVFKRAIENLVEGYIFGDIRKKTRINEEEISIHDQIYYRKFLEYILNKPQIKKRQKRRVAVKKAREEFIEKNKEINLFMQQSHGRIGRYW